MVFLIRLRGLDFSTCFHSKTTGRMDKHPSNENSTSKRKRLPKYSYSGSLYVAQRIKIVLGKSIPKLLWFPNAWSRGHRCLEMEMMRQAPRSTYCPSAQFALISTRPLALNICPLLKQVGTPHFSPASEVCSPCVASLPYVARSPQD